MGVPVAPSVTVMRCGPSAVIASNATVTFCRRASAVPQWLFWMSVVQRSEYEEPAPASIFQTGPSCQ